MATVSISTTLGMRDYEPFRAFAELHGLSDSTTARIVLKDFLDSADPKRVLQYVVKGKKKT